MTKPFVYRGRELPDKLRASLDRYAEEGADPGGFLSHFLSGDLFRACLYADDDAAFLPIVACYIHQELRSECHGSKAKVAAWIASKQQQREAAR